MWYFYILQSIPEPKYFYKGSTNDLDRRLTQHNNGEVASSRPRRPYRLVYYEAFISEKAARKRESSVKKSGSVSVPLMKRIKESLDDGLPRRSHVVRERRGVVNDVVVFDFTNL